MTSTENKIKATATMNNEANGIEISFTGKPSASVRETMKTFGFRWHNVKSVWYAKQTPERVKFAKSLEKANDLTSDDKPSKASDKPSKASKPEKASEKASEKANKIEYLDLPQELREALGTMATDFLTLMKRVHELTERVEALEKASKPLSLDEALALDKALRKSNASKASKASKPKSDNAMTEEEKDKARTLEEAKARAKREAKRNK